MSQYLKYKKALEKFIDSIKNDEEIIGILISGSYYRKKLDKNSDIDIHLILDKSCEYRERGNVWIDGIEIEYFKNPPQQIRSYFKKEKDSPHTADMFVNSIVVRKSTKIIDELIEEAKQILLNKPKKFEKSEIEISKYHLNDLYKDLDDCVEKKDKIGFSFVKQKIIDECIFIVLGLKQIRRTKEKRLFAQIEQIDPVLSKLIEETFEEEILKTDKIKELVEHTEKCLGGKRSKEWVLKSDLDLYN